MNTALFVLGLVILVLGVLAAGYTVYENKVYFFGAYEESLATKPYSALAAPLIIIGLFIMLFSALTPTVKTVTHKSYVENPVRVKKTKVVEED